MCAVWPDVTIKYNMIFTQKSPNSMPTISFYLGKWENFQNSPKVVTIWATFVTKFASKTIHE